MGIQIDVQARTSKAEQELAAINNSLRNIEKTTNKTSESIKNMVKGLASITTVGLSVNYLKGISTEFTELGNKIATVTGRTKELVKVQEELYQLSEDTRSSLRATVSTFASFGRSLKDAGVSNEKILRATKAVQEALALSGSSAESANAAIIQLGQGLSSGVLRGEELNSVLEQAPRIAQAISDELGVTSGKLRILAADGKLTSDVVFSALLKQSSKINKEFSTLAPTLSQSTSLLSDSIKIYVNELDKGMGLTAAMGISSANLAKQIKKASANAFELGTRIAFTYNRITSGAGMILGPIVQTFKELGKQFLKVLPEGFLTRTLRGDINQAIREFDKFSGGLISGFKRFSILDLFTIESDVQKAIKKLKRLSPKYWAASGFDVPTIKQFFSRDNLQAYAGAFKDLAVAVAGNTDSIGGRITEFFRKIDFGFKAISRYFGFRLDTIFTFRAGNLENFLNTLAEITRGISGVGIKVWEFTKIIRTNFYPATVAFTDALIDSLGKVPGAVYDAISVAVKAILKVVQITLQIVKDVVDSFSIRATFESAYESVEKFFNGLRKKANLNDVVEAIRDFGRKVIQVFFTIYDEVIGHSWWTDTVESVVNTSNSLWDRASSGLNRFKTNTIKIFKEAFSSSNKLKFNVGDIKSIDFSFKSFKMPVLKTDSLVENFADSIEQIKTLFTNLFEAFPSLMKLAIVGAAGVAVSLMFPAGAIKSVLIAGILTSLATSSTLIAEQFGMALTGGSFVSQVGYRLGQIAGSFVASMIRELPSFLNALLGTVAAFARGFVEELPLIGGALKKIFSVADSVGASGPLGLIGAFLIGKTVKGLLDVLGLGTDTMKSIESIFGRLVKVVSGNGEGVISKYLFGTLGSTRALAAVGLVLDSFGVFESLFANSALAQYALKGGLLYTLFAGKAGVDKIADTIGAKVIAPVSDAIQGIGKNLLKGTSLYEVFFGDTGTWAERASVAIKSVIDKISGSLVDLAAPYISKGYDFLKTLILGKNPEKTIAYMQLFVMNIMDDMAFTIGRMRQKIGDKLSEVFSKVSVKGTSVGGISIDTGKISDMAKKAADAMSRIGGEHGLLGRLYFGKYGKAALIATLLALFSTVTFASENSGFASEKTTSPFEDLVSNWQSLKLQNPFVALAIEITAVAIPMILGALYYFRREAVKVMMSVFSLSNITSWARTAGTTIGMVAKNAKGIIAGALGGGLGYMIGEQLSPGMGMVGAELGAMMAFAMRNAILRGLMWLGGAIVTVLTAKVTAILAGIAAVGGALYLFFFGKKGEFLSELDKVWQKLKEIVGFGGNKNKSLELGISKDLEKFSKSRNLGLDYNLTTINSDAISSADKTKLDKKLEELAKVIEQSIDEEEKTGRVSGDTRDSIAALNRSLKNYSEKLASKNVPEVKNFGKFMEDIKNVDPYSYADVIGQAIRQASLTTTFKLNESLIRIQRFASVTPEQKRSASERLDALRAQRDTKYNAGYRGFQEGEDRIRGLEKRLEDIRANGFENDLLKAEIDRIKSQYVSITKQVVSREAGFFGNEIIPQDDPMIQKKLELENELINKMQLQVWYDQQKKSIEAFRKDLSGINSGLKDVGITFDANELFAADTQDFERLKEIGDELKRLSKELENASNIAEKNAIIVRINEFKTQVVEIKTKAQVESLDRKQYKLRETLEGIGIGVFTDETLKRLSDENADNLFKLATDLQIQANQLKRKKPVKLETLSPDEKINEAIKAAGGFNKLTAAQIEEIKKAPEKFLPKEEDYLKALAEHQTNLTNFVNEIIRITSGGAETLMPSLRDLANSVGVDFVEAVRTRGLATTEKGVKRLLELQGKLDSGKLGEKDFRATANEAKRLRDNLTEALPTLNNMISDLSSLGSQFTLEDLGLATKGQLKKLQTAAATVRSINKQLEQLGPNASQSTIDKILIKKTEAAKQAFEVYLELLYATPERLQQAFARVGVNSNFEISFLSDDTMKQFLEIDSRIQSLQNALKDPKNADAFRDINRELDKANREAERLRNTLNTRSSLGAVNKAYGTNFTEQEFGRLPKDIQKQLATDATDIAGALERALTKPFESGGGGKKLSEIMAAQVPAQTGKNGATQIQTPSLETITVEAKAATLADIIDDLRKTAYEAFQTVQKSGVWLADQLSQIKFSKVSDLVNKIGEGLPALADYKDAIERLSRSDQERLANIAATLSDAKKSFDAGLITYEELRKRTQAGKAEAATVLDKSTAYGAGTAATLKDIGIEVPQAQMNLMSEAAKAKVDNLTKAYADAVKQLDSATTDSDRIAAQNLVNEQRSKLSDAVAVATYDVRAKAEEAGRALGSAISESITSGLTDLLSGKTGWKDFLSNVMNTVTNSIISTFVKGLMDPLTGENGILTTMFKNIGTKLFSSAASAGWGFASGGYVSGPGTGTSDSIPAYLSNGEYVINAKATRDNFGLLHAINNGGISRFAEGGAVGDAAAPTVAAATTGIDPNSASGISMKIDALSGKVDMGFTAVANQMAGLNSQIGNGFTQLTVAMAMQSMVSSISTMAIMGNITSMGMMNMMYTGIWGEAILMAVIASSMKLASGGYVSGPGTGTSDSISAMLSNGEYVVNAASTKKFRPLLESINNGQTPRFADGGLVGGSVANSPIMAVPASGSINANNSSTNKPTNQVFNINITGDVSRQTRAEIQRMIPNIATGVNSYNREKG